MGVGRLTCVDKRVGVIKCGRNFMVVLGVTKTPKFIYPQKFLTLRYLYVHHLYITVYYHYCTFVYHSLDYQHHQYIPLIVSSEFIDTVFFSQ